MSYSFTDGAGEDQLNESCEHPLKLVEHVAELGPIAQVTRRVQVPGNLVEVEADAVQLVYRLSGHRSGRQAVAERRCSEELR